VQEVLESSTSLLYDFSAGKEHLNARKAKAKAPVGKIPLTLPLFLHPHTLRHIFDYLMIEIMFDRS
jgi:hypothetical protein